MDRNTKFSQNLELTSIPLKPQKEKIEPRSTVIFDVLPHRPHIPEAAAAPKRTAFNLRVRDYLLLERGFFEGFVREIEAAAESFLPPRTLSTGEDISAQFAPDASGAVAFSAKTEKPDAFSAPAEESFSAETPAENYSAAEVERFCVGMGPDLLTGEPLAPGGEGETPGNGCDPFDFWDFGWLNSLLTPFFWKNVQFKFVFNLS